MALNEDGLEPGQPVDFETYQRIRRKHVEKKYARTESKPAKRVGRPKKNKDGEAE